MSDQIVITTPDAGTLKAELSPIVARAEQMLVVDRASHEAGQLFLADLRRAEKSVRVRIDPIIDTAHKAHKQLTALRADVLRPIDGARQLVEGKLTAYEREEQRKAAALRLAAEAAARKAAEERALLEAIEAEDAGDIVAAEQIIAEPVVTPIVKIETQTAKVEGISTRTTYSAEVTDLGALVAYVAANTSALNLIMPNMPALNSLARAMREQMTIPGVRAVATQTKAVRT